MVLHGPAGSRVAAAMAALASASFGLPFLRCYRYRVVLQGVDERVSLQIVTRATGVPDTLPLSIWPGLAGLHCKVTPGTLVIVAFPDHDASHPVVVSFDPSVDPLEVSIKAARVAIGLGTKPVASATELLIWATAVTSALSGLGVVVPPLPPTVASTKLFTE